MDYGQPVNNLNQEPFFTAGAGNVSETVNPDVNNSLNSGIYSPDHDPRTVGNTAISSTNQEILLQPQQSENSPNFPQQTLEILPQQTEISGEQNLGQIVDLSLPPGAKQDNPIEATKETGPPPEIDTIKTTEKLNKSGIKVVDDALLKFKQDSNAADFYSTARSMMEKNLKNSYGELASWKGKAA